MKFRFDHNSINVKDLEKSLNFYRDALGLVETRRIKDLKSPRYSNQAYLNEHYEELLIQKFQEVEAA